MDIVLPNDVLFPIISKLTLGDVRNMSLVCKKFNDIINVLDWGLYCSSHNPIINLNFVANKEFMKTQGIYLLKIKNQKVITSWLKIYPYIEILRKIVEEKDYSVVNNSILLKQFFEDNIGSTLSIKIAFGYEYSYIIYLSKNKYTIVEYWHNIFSSRYDYKDNVLNFIKLKMLKEEFDYISFQINDYVFFRECL
jgi:hypothetical protein